MPHRDHPLYARILVSLGVVLCAIFAVGAIWYQGPSVVALRVLLVAAWLGLSATSLVLFVRGYTAVVLLAFAVPFAGLVLWFDSIHPRNDRVWSPEMARTITFVAKGDTIVVSNVRNFHWTGPATADPRWETRTYDLTTLAHVDVLSLYWKGPGIAHTYFSFVWQSGEALSISVEIRKEKDETYSPVGGFFKAYELAVLAGDERVRNS